MFNIGLEYSGFKIEIKSDSLKEPLAASLTLSACYSF